MAHERAPGNESPNIPKPLSVEEFKKLKVGQNFYIIHLGNVPVETGPHQIISFGGVFGSNDITVVRITKPPGESEESLNFSIGDLVKNYKIFLHKEDAETELDRLALLN